MPILAALPRAPRSSLVESTIELIRGRVESGAWKVGARIPKEQELADMLHVGRNTVREAIRVLSHANVLEVRQGDGTYVRSNVDPAEVMRRVGRSSLRDHLELRAMLEAEAARLAAANRSKEGMVQLRKLLRQRGERSDHADMAAFVERDLAFHSGIAHVSGNLAVAELYRYFSGSVRLHMAAAMAEGDLPEPELAAHQAILDAIDRGDEDGAAIAARAVIVPLITLLSDVRR